MPSLRPDEPPDSGIDDHIDEHICYDDAIEYWTSVDATIDGMLGGYGEATSVPKADIVGSTTLLRKLKGRYSCETGKSSYALDFGAGIGRVTKNLLSKECAKVDLLEPVKPFLDQMKVELQPLMKQGKIGEIFPVPMQDWVPQVPHKYSLLWCQWCSNHLHDDDFIRWLDRCRTALQHGGLLVVKENNASGLEDVYDPEDSSKTRTDGSFRKLFRRAGWNVLLAAKQRGLPRELYTVRMYALQPEERK